MSDIKPTLPTLTDKQAMRIAAHLAGQSTAAIAKSEGVSRQAVEKTISRETVRQHIADLASNLQVNSLSSGEVKSTDAIITKLITEMAELAMTAKKHVVLSFTSGEHSYQEIKDVPDYRTRLDATTRLIEIFLDSERPISGTKALGSSITPATKEEIVQEVETLRTRSRQIKSSGG